MLCNYVLIWSNANFTHFTFNYQLTIKKIKTCTTILARLVFVMFHVKYHISANVCFS